MKIKYYYQSGCFLLVFMLLFGSCQVSEKKNSTSPVKIILDTDMGSDCDDVGALALLHRYADLGKVETLGCINNSGKVPYSAGVIEAINIYYGRPDISEPFADYLNKMISNRPLLNDDYR